MAISQGNYNPYIEHPETVAPAWGLTPPGPVFRFASPSGSLVEGNAGPSTYTLTLNLAPAATAATSVQVSLNAAASTATNGTDFAFPTPTTVTFPAGSTSQTVTVTVTGDTQPEADETVVLTLATASTGTSVGSPGTHTLTILNDDGPPPTVAFASAGGSILEGNAGTSTYTVNVTASGTLPAGAIGNVGITDATTRVQTDTLSTVCYFSGAHSVALFNATDTLDVIGVIGQTPASGGWAVPNGSTLNNTLVRQPTTSQGGRWNGPNGSVTWSAGGVDNYAGVGSYVSSACFIPTATRPASGLRDALEIYPNPASETVQLRLPGLPTARPATVEVLDILGRSVRQRTAPLSATDAASVDLRGLPAGLYAVRVSCAGLAYTGRVVVQ